MHRDYKEATCREDNKKTNNDIYQITNMLGIQPADQDVLIKCI